MAALTGAGSGTVAGGTGSAPASGGGNWWDTILQVATPILSSIAGAALGNDGVNKATDAQNAASQQSLALQRDIFNTNLGLSKPFYQSGVSANQMLDRIYGLTPQNVSFPSGLSGSNAFSSGGLSANLGAGQPVAGHTGGGGPNAFAQAAGNIAGTYFGGPVGGTIGSMLGGLIRNGGDNWTTIATQAPGGFDYGAYMQQPDLAAEWAKPDTQALFGGNSDAYANWHYNQFGKNEGRTLNPTASQDQTPQGNGQAGNSFSAGASTDPLQAFWNSPDGQLAKNQFLTIDNPAIKGAFATAGKSLSGAQQKALADRGAAMGGNAFNNYRGGLERMAGYGSAASSNAQNAGNSFANSASNIMQNTGLVNANAATQKNANWGNAFDATYKTASNKGWI
jgi:hypothetical protein